MKGFLYVADEDGREIPGSRRSLAHVERGDGRFRQIENELKRLAGEGCTVRYSETERKLRGSGFGQLAGYLFAALFYGSIVATALGWLA